MSAVRALKVKSVAKKLPVAAKNAKKSKGKIIKLPLKNKALPKPRGLSDKQKETLVLDHRIKAGKLARSILRKWRARLDLDEIDSVVDLSLCEAVRRFNPAKGASFITFLFYHLRGNLIRAISSAANAHGVPLESEGEHVCFNGAGPMVSANEVAEALCSHEIALPDEILYKKEMLDLSRQACEKLDDLEKEVVGRVFIKEQQLMDVAQDLGYSRCHISRVKKKALEALLSEMRSFGEIDRNQIDGLLDEEPTARRPIARRGADRRRVHVERLWEEEQVAAQA